MRLLDKYLLRELLAPLSFCLGGFTISFLAFSLFKDLDELKDSKLRFFEVVQYCTTVLPEMIVTVLPIALLLALLYALSNHARYHEITAIRAAGVSLWRLSLPYFAVGIACSAVLFALNELAVPESAIRAERILNKHSDKGKGKNPELVHTLGFVNSAAGREWQIGTYNLRTAEMHNVWVIWSLKDGTQRWLVAPRAVHTNSGWLFIDAREYRSDPKITPNLVPSFTTNALHRAWDETPAQIRSEVKISSLIAAKLVRQADLPLTEIYNYLRLHPVLPPQDRAWLETKLHGRLAMPWTCLVVVLIALPFGAASGRRNVFVGVASSIVIAIGFFLLMQLGLALGSGGKAPAWLAAWLPNIVFGTVGLWLTARVR